MFELITQNLPAFWMLLGFSLLAIEMLAFGMASGVLLFGGIGAVLTGLLLWGGVIAPEWLYSVAAFVIASVLVSLVLWAPLKRLQRGQQMGRDQSSDLVGREFTLDSIVSTTQPGTNRYSGIDWRVEIDSASGVTELASGVRVKVTKVDAGIFHVSPIESS